MKEIPSAEEFYIQEMKEFYNKLDSVFPEELVKMAAPTAARHYIEFAKLHVEAALEAAAEKIKSDALRDFGSEVPDCWNLDSILNAYPETNIK